jgi:hypothetical protein
MDITNLIKNEPVLIAGLVQAIIGLLLVFGVNLNDAQVAAIMTVTAIVLAILARIFVTPNNQIEKPPTIEIVEGSS